MIRLYRLVSGTFVATVVLAMGFAQAPESRSSAEKKSDSRDDTSLIERLSKEFSGTISGRSRREACESIAQFAQVNFWLHPEVDPSARINVDGTAMSTWQALSEIAADADGSIYPVAGIVVIGPRDWVDSFAATSFRATVAPKISVEWPMLTTPTEARDIVKKQAASAGHRSPDSISDLAGRVQTLDHDLWPHIQWRDLDANVALGLVHCQSDRRRSATTTARTDVASPIMSAYPASVRTSIAQETDPRATIAKISRGRTRVTTTIDGHLAIREAWIEMLCEKESDRAAAMKGTAKTAGSDNRRFTLRVQARLSEVLAQLAAQRKVMLVWDGSLSQAQKDQLVDLTAKDATLDELAKKVAQQTKLEIQISDHSWVVSPPTAR